MLKELVELQREDAQLKVAAWNSRLEALVHKTLLDVVSKKYHIDVKKDRFRVVELLKSTTYMGKKIGIKRLCQLVGVSRKGFYKYVRANVEVDEGIKASSVLCYCLKLRQDLPKAGVPILQTLCNEYFAGAFMSDETGSIVFWMPMVYFYVVE